ncbi:MAG: S8 family serine peptidase [Acidithiobacillales bacterium]
MRILKVFCTKEERRKLRQEFAILETYDGFVLLQGSPVAARRLAKTYVVEDITSQYAIRTGERVIKTSLPRIDEKGRTRPHTAYRRVRRLPSGPHHYLVQFIGPIKRAWLSAVKKAGGEPRTPYGGFAYVVRSREKALSDIAGLRFVRWVGHLPYSDRIASSALENAGRAPTDLTSKLLRTKVRPGIYTVEFFGKDDLARAVPAVKRLGLKIVAEQPGAGVLMVRAEGTKASILRALAGLSAVHGVRFIRERVLKRTSNDVAAGIMGSTRSLSTTASGLGLSGKGEIVGICDTGLDSGDPDDIHPDFTGRVAWIKSYPITPDFNQEIFNPGGDDGPADLDSGHGTHTSGSILGSGASSAGLGLAAPIRGLAYAARLAFQAVEQEMKWKDPALFKNPGRYILAGIPNDLKKLLGDSYAQGARIHSNSWGGGDPGAYDDQCQQLDEFVSSHRDFCVVAASGNDGTDGDGDGKINPMSVSSPGTAKNCITVGACENERTGFNGERYGDWWPGDFPVPPFKNDPMADDPDQVVAFSSRGPTQDGRTKPEVVAPGTFVLSTRSTRIAPNNPAWGAFPPSKLYFFMGGTSMATPLTAGAVAVIREFLRKQQGIKSPTAALLKAALIAGAKRLPKTAPRGTLLDNSQGFGRVNLDAILAPAKPASARFIDASKGLQTGQVDAYTLNVQSNKAPLRIALAYTDPPGPALVNNLNLIVKSPSGTTFVGNQRAGGSLTPDTSNNAEVIQVRRPAAGAWRLEVVASNVPQGPQDYALVWLGHF